MSKHILISVCNIWGKDDMIHDYLQWKNRVKHNRTVTIVWKEISSAFTSMIYLSITERRADWTNNFKHHTQLWFTLV